MSETHASEAAHARGLSRDFGLYSKMDVRFWQAFFTNIVRISTVVSYVAIDPRTNTLAGYIIGTTDASDLTRQLLRRLFFPLTRYGLQMLVRHPGQLRLVINNVLARNKQPAIPRQRWITWMVMPAYRKHGVGLELYKLLCSEMRARGVNEFYGPVDCENEASNKAHEKIKAQKVGTIIVDGRDHYLWKHSASNREFD